MDQGPDDIRQNIEQTRASLDSKLNKLEDKASDAGDTVREASQKALDMIDIRGQVAERPWTALGVAVAAGYVLGSMGSDDQPNYSRYEQHPQGWAGRSSSSTSYDQRDNADSGPSTTDKIKDKGSDLLSQFDDEIDMLKGAAITAVTTFLRDSVRDYAPGIGKYIDDEMQKRGISGGSSARPRSYSSSSSSSSSGGGRQVSSSPTESFDEASKMPNADYDNIGQMNRVGMPPQNNPSDSEYYETYTPGTSSDRPEPPAATPRKMDAQAENETRKYSQ